MSKTHAFLDEDDTMMSSERKIFKLIYENDIKGIKDMKPHLRDLNYFEEFQELEIDSKVTPLIVASHLGKTEIVKIFLQNEHIDINLGSHDLQLTPLCVACTAGNYEVVEALINNGADINKPDMLTRSPLSFCFTRLQEDTNVFENNLICMKMAYALLQNGADIDSAINKEKGKTLLMDYCSVDTDMSLREKDANFKVIKFLLENGADPSRKSKKGKTALDYCKRHPFKDDIQRMLLNTHQTYFHYKTKGLIPISDLYRVKKFKMFSAEGSSTNTCCNIFGSCQ